MAEEQASTAAASAQTAVSSPLSSQSQSQSTSDSAAQTAASTSTQSSQAGTTEQKTETAVTRPEGIPDSYWDTEKNSLKVDPAALAKDLKERDELKTFKAADDIRKGALPKTAAEYKAELPKDFKFPVGVEYKFDEKDPLLTHARDMAFAKGIGQSDFSEFLGLYASAKVSEQIGKESFKADQIKQLGANSGNRVDTVTNYWTGLDGSADKGHAKAIAEGMQTARQVEAFEYFINRLSSQGTAGFTQSHRAAAETNAIPGYENMSFEQRRHAQDQNAARRRA